MAVNKITEKAVAESVKDEAHVLITQPEGSAGSEVETLERATITQLNAATGLTDARSQIDALAVQMERINGVVAGTVRHDEYQTLSAESKLRARSNIGLNFTENYLTWGENAERRLARHNIGVLKVAEVYNPLETYTRGRYVIFDGDLYRLDADRYGPAPDIWGGDWTFINPTQEPVSLAARTYTEAQKQQARENIEAAPLGIMPETYGAKGDGTTDDTDALLNCLTAAYQQKRPVYFREGRTYTTSRELQIYNRIALYGNGATIKFTGTSGNMLFYSDTDVDQFPDEAGRAVIRDLAFDGNSAATCCIAIGMAKGLVIENLDVYGFTGVGIASAAGFENFFRDIRIAGDGSAGQRGMICGASDSRYTEIVTKNCETGIRNEGGANTFDHVHSWNTVAAIIPTSVMMETVNALRAYNLYADTCAVGVKVLNDVSVLVTGFILLHGESLVSGHTPCVFQPVSAAAIDRIKCSGAEWINSSASGVSYNLFSLDPGAYGRGFDWRQANAASLQAMGNLPGAYALTDDRPTFSETGAEVSFFPANGARYKVVTTFLPVQDGTPSPDAPVAITGTAGLTLTKQVGSEAATTHEVAFTEAVLGGVYDWSAGTLTPGFGVLVLDGSSDENWGINTTQGCTVRGTCLNDLPSVAEVNAKDNREQFYCDRLQNYAKYSHSGVTTMRVYPNNTKLLRLEQFQVATGISTVADLRAWLADHPLTIVYPLPEASLTPTAVGTAVETIGAEGLHTVGTDTGEITASGYATMSYIPPAPVEDGTYRLTVTVANRRITGAWEAAGE